MVVYVGDDWAEDHHDVHLMDEAGERLAARRLPESAAGVTALHALVAEHASGPGEVSPTSCAPTGTTTGRSPATATRPARCASSPVPTSS